MSGRGVAVIGLGVGEQHARAYREAGCELRWLCDLDLGKAEHLAHELGGRATTQWRDVLADPAVEVVSIASFDDAHHEQCLASLNAGKHVFVEKPLCRTQDELASLHSAWRASGVHLGSNLVLRAAPAFVRLKGLLDSRRLGQPYAIDGDYLYGRLAKITDGWRKDVEDYSVLAGGGVHLIDLMLWLTGERPTSVGASSNKICSAGTAFRYPDFSAARFEFPSGLIGRITANFGCVTSHQHVLRVFGTEATFLSDDAGPRLYEARERAPTPWPEAPLPPGKGALLHGFLADLDASASRGQEHFDTITVCLAADRAARGRANVEIEYLA